jgi:serine/threonine protein kinase
MTEKIDEKYVQYYFSQLTNGLKYLYNMNIIHRDLKPKNILLTKGRRIIKIADFGLAKRIGHKQDLNSTMCGSPMYMAPEIINNSKYNNQTDLWSIGLIMYEMLFGQHPYSSCNDITELKDMVNNDDIKIPPDNTKISKDCAELLKCLLSKDVEKRMLWEDFFNNKWITKHQCEVEFGEIFYPDAFYAHSLGNIVCHNNIMTVQKYKDINVINDYIISNNNNELSDEELNKTDCDEIFSLEFEDNFNVISVEDDECLLNNNNNNCYTYVTLKDNI